jgi:23S rRNA pseudouridine2605 synthase
MEERLQKILAQHGIASRRHAEQLIVAGTVRVNGQVALLGQKADPTEDRIEVNGECLGRSPRPAVQYILLNKPLDFVTTCRDPWGRPTVMDLLPSEYRSLGLHPVGRLDAQTTGALLLSNDGDLTFALTHPAHSIPKTYEVQVCGKPSAKVLTQWRQGIILEGRMTCPAQVSVIKPFCGALNATELKVVLREGRKRQIRLVAKALGHPVLRLHRTQIGPISLEDSSGRILSLGKSRPLTALEIEKLRHIITFKSCIGNRKEAP